MKNLAKSNIIRHFSKARAIIISGDLRNLDRLFDFPLSLLLDSSSMFMCELFCFFFFFNLSPALFPDITSAVSRSHFLIGPSYCVQVNTSV